MKIVKPIFSEIEEFLRNNKGSDDISIKHIAIGNRSIVYKLNNYCFKKYTPIGEKDGECEYQALLALQSSDYVPELFAYLPGKFVLTQWIEGLNLTQFRETYGRIPENTLHHMFTSELEQINAGYKDWDFKLNENLIWTKSGEVRRIDFGLCEPVEGRKDYLKNELFKRIEKIYAKDPVEIGEVQQELYRGGLYLSEIEEALTDFQLQTPWLV